MWVFPLTQLSSEWQNQLKSLSSHLIFVGGNEFVIRIANQIQNHLLNTVESVKQALDATEYGMWCYIERMQFEKCCNSVLEAHNSMLVLHDTFSELIGLVNVFFMGPRKPYDREIYEWYRCIRVRS